MTNRNFRDKEPRRLPARASSAHSFAVQSPERKRGREQGELFMPIVRLTAAAALFGSAAAAHATTVVIFVEPMTLERYTRVFDTPGPDRLLLCMAPPATSGCTDVTPKVRR
jgi:hypothetical protein